MEQQNNSHRKRLIWAAVLILLLIAAGIAGVSAKYVQDFGGTDVIAKAKEFYFTSDLLTVGGAKYTLNPETSSISFKLMNHDDQLRYSEDPVSYTVSVDGGGTLDSTSGVLSNDADTVITLSGLEKGKIYTVTATGSAGYKKVLTATFTVLDTGKKVFKYLDTPDPSGNYILLTVWTEDISGDMIIQFPDGLIPDATDNELADVVNYNAEQSYYDAYTIQIDDWGKYHSHTFRFFLETPYSYPSIGSFSVSLDTAIATEGTP